MKCNVCDQDCHPGPEDAYCGECGHPASAHIHEELVRKEPAGDLNAIARIYLRGDLKQSRERLIAYVAENPSDALAWTILGHVHKDLADYPEAERAYRKAIELNPGSYQAYTGLGIVRSKKGDLDGAMAYYDRALKINPRYAQAFTSMSVVELKRHDDRRALELAQKAYRLDNRDRTIVSNLAVAYHYNNLFADRDRMYEECRRLGCSDLQALDRIFRGEITIRH